jgi:hypothetical protein
MDGIGSPGGYDIFLDERYARYINRSQGRDLEKFLAYERLRKGSRLIRHTGAEFLLSSFQLSNGRSRSVRGYEFFEPYKKIGGLYLHRDAQVSPRAVLVHRVEVVPDELDTYRRMESDGFDMRETALIEAQLPGGFAKPEPPSPGQPEKAEIVVYEPNLVEIHVNASSKAVLVLSDTLHPGWRAEIDGEAVPLVHANRIMRAVPVPSGESQVVMKYLPTSFVIGGVVTLLSLLGLIVWRALWYPAKASPKAPHQKASHLNYLWK